MARLFCFGLGYSAKALVNRLVGGWSFAASLRPAAPGERRDLPKNVRFFDFGPEGLKDPETALAGVSHILVSIPPEAQGDPVLRHHRDQLAAMEGLAWVGYLSTTSVYGDHDGAWVDEETPPKPSLARAKRRLAAEKAWLDLGQDTGLSVQIFRLAGIYGPGGRSVLYQAASGQAKCIGKPGQVFGRIHVTDIAAVLKASIERPRNGAIYNVSDDLPAPPAEVVRHACKLLGVAPPPAVPFEEAELSEMARSFYADNKRVRNDLIKQELGVRLKYPDYKAGLAAIHAEEFSG
jgi:nucleoside-diphosphate-sugar epimerase